jgi:hypothetical protein
MEAQIEIQPVARATTPTIAPTTETARMGSSAGENSPPALLAAGHDEQDARRRR